MSGAEQRVGSGRQDAGERSARHRPPLDPRGLSRADAAAYVGISPSLFMVMVEDGRMPKPRLANARRIWDRRELDVAIDDLPHDGETPAANEWDSVLP